MLPFWASHIDHMQRLAEQVCAGGAGQRLILSKDIRNGCAVLGLCRIKLLEGYLESSALLQLVLA